MHIVVIETALPYLILFDIKMFASNWIGGIKFLQAYFGVLFHYMILLKAVIINIYILKL